MREKACHARHWLSGIHLVFSSDGSLPTTCRDDERGDPAGMTRGGTPDRDDKRGKTCMDGRRASLCSTLLIKRLSQLVMPDIGYRASIWVLQDRSLPTTCRDDKRGRTCWEDGWPGWTTYREDDERGANLPE